MVLHQVQNPSRDLLTARNARLDLVGIILCFCANQPKIQHREPMRNCLPQNAIVEDVQSGRGQSLHEWIREMGIVNHASAMNDRIDSNLWMTNALFC